MHSAAPRRQRAHFPVPAAAFGSVPQERTISCDVASKAKLPEISFFPQWQIPRNWVSRRQLNAIHKKIIHSGQKWGKINFPRQIECVRADSLLIGDERCCRQTAAVPLMWIHTCMIKYGANAARTIIHRCVAGLFIQLTRESWGERTAPIGSCASCVWVWHFMSSGFSWVTVRPTGAVIIHFFSFTSIARAYIGTELWKKLQWTAFFWHTKQVRERIIIGEKVFLISRAPLCCTWFFTVDIETRVALCDSWWWFWHWHSTWSRAPPLA